MKSQLSKLSFSKAPDQPLIQLFFILPQSEYEVEKRTFCNGLQLDRKDTLLAVRPLFKNLQRLRKRGGGGRTTGVLPWPTLEGGPAENVIPRQAPTVVGRDEEVMIGEGAGITRMERRKNNPRRQAARLVGVKLTNRTATA